MGITFSGNANRRFDHILDRGAGNAPVYPVQGHLIGRKLPDFFIIRDHVAFGNPFPECIVDPFPEILWERQFAFFNGHMRLYKLVDTEEPVLLGKVRKPVLKRVFYILIFVKNFCVSVVALFVSFNHLPHESEHFCVARKNDMRTANIEGKSLFGLRAAESAILRFLFKDNHIVALFMEEAGQRES